MPSVGKIESFWDASALVPLCARQSASVAAREALKGRAIAAWWATPVEIVGALCRLLRFGDLSQKQWEQAVRRLGDLRRWWTEIMPDDRVRELAGALLQQHPLRAADALQLAAALVWAEERPQTRHFVCLDRRLAEAATKEGFAVETFGLIPR